MERKLHDMRYRQDCGSTKYGTIRKASFDPKLSYHKEDSAYERILYEMAGNEADCKHPSDKGENDMETVRLAALYAERGRGVVAADLAGQKDFMQQIHLQMYSEMPFERGVPFTIHAR